MNPSNDLLGQLLSRLATGQNHIVTDLAHATASTPAEIAHGLDILQQAGLDLIKPTNGSVALAAPFAALDESIMRAELVRAGLDADVSVATLIESTNTTLLNAARTGALPAAGPGMTILAAEMQRAGRGRQGRAWYARAGTSLTVSFARHLSQPLGELSGLSLVCGLAVRDTLLRQGVTTELKWPNDLLFAGKKLGGILVEVHPDTQSGTWVVIGVGLNIAPDAARARALREAPEASLPVTDLHSCGAVSPTDRNRIVVDMAVALSLRLTRFEAAGFSEFSADWNAHHAYRDRPVELIERGTTLYRGIARGVDRLGRLRLDTESGSQSVVAGDVSLRIV